MKQKAYRGSAVVFMTAVVLTAIALATVPKTMSRYTAEGTGAAAARIAKWDPEWLIRLRTDNKHAMWDRGVGVYEVSTDYSIFHSGNQVFALENNGETTVDAIFWMAFLTPADLEFWDPTWHLSSESKPVAVWSKSKATLHQRQSGRTPSQYDGHSRTPTSDLSYITTLVNDTASDRIYYQDYGFVNYDNRLLQQDPFLPLSSVSGNPTALANWNWFNAHKVRSDEINMTAFDYDGNPLPATPGSGSFAWWLGLQNNAAGQALAERCKSIKMPREGVYAGDEYEGSWRFRIEPGDIAVVRIDFREGTNYWMKNMRNDYNQAVSATINQNVGRMCRLYAKVVQVD